MDTISFLEELTINNNREWFAAHRADYEQVLLRVETLTAQIISGIAATDSSLLGLKPKECLFRIYRDTRFSKDKTPYKNHIGIYINRGGKCAPYAGYYLHMEPQNCFVCGGVYRPQAANLRALRTAVDSRFAELQRILNSSNFARYYDGLSQEDDTLSRVPRGFSTASPAAEYLKMKHFIATHHFDVHVVRDDDFVGKVIEMFSALCPLVEFLNEAMFGDD